MIYYSSQPTPSPLSSPWLCLGRCLGRGREAWRQVTPLGSWHALGESHTPESLLEALSRLDAGLFPGTEELRRRTQPSGALA